MIVRSSHGSRLCPIILVFHQWNSDLRHLWTDTGANSDC